MTDQHSATPAADGHGGLALFLAWSFVGIPLTLGVVQTIINALKLFQ
jgi:hypothetical protein